MFNFKQRYDKQFRKFVKFLSFWASNGSAIICELFQLRYFFDNIISFYFQKLYTRGIYYFICFLTLKLH